MISETRPKDFSVAYESYSPPLASPHSWKRVVRIGPDAAGHVQLQADNDAPNAPEWTLTFPLYDAHLDWLYDALLRLQVFDTEWHQARDVPVGGGAERLTVAAQGREFVIPPFVSDGQTAFAASARAAVEALVPPSCWPSSNGVV